MNNSSLEKICDGVFLWKGKDVEAPATIVYDGAPLIRFMDIFFLGVPAEHLSQHQVSCLCTARTNNPESITNSEANNKVKRVLERIVISLRPSSLLEIGAGRSPTLTPGKESASIDYVLSDMDPECVEHNSNLGRTSIHFSYRSKISYSDDYFKLIIAAFVFHFHVTDHQIKEISRCLSEDGAVIFNLYNRQEKTRRELLASFREAGLLIIRLPDQSGICRANEYWIAAKNQRALHFHEQHAKREITIP